MPEMRCAGCMEAGTVVFMESVLCGECFFRQTVVARAIRRRFEAPIGRSPVPVAPAWTAEARDLVGRMINRLERDLSDLLSSSTTPNPSVTGAGAAAPASAETRGRAARRGDKGRGRAAVAPRGGPNLESPCAR